MEHLTPFEVVASIICGVVLLITIVEFVVHFYIDTKRWVEPTILLARELQKTLLL